MLGDTSFDSARYSQAIIPIVQYFLLTMAYFMMFLKRPRNGSFQPMGDFDFSIPGVTLCN